MPDGSETALKQPSGVYVSAEKGLIYIADTENARVLISDLDGNVQLEITKPDSEVFDQKRTFLPAPFLVPRIYAARQTALMTSAGTTLLSTPFMMSPSPVPSSGAFS